VIYKSCGEVSYRLIAMLIKAGQEELILLDLLLLQRLNSFLRLEDLGLVSLRRWIVVSKMHLDVLAFNLLHRLFLMRIMFPVLVELREA
jgi:hypothetical protein